MNLVRGIHLRGDVMLTDEQRMAYLDDLIQIGRKHGLSLSHEDGHGAFVIEKLDAFNEAWLKNAQDGTGE